MMSSGQKKKTKPNNECRLLWAGSLYEVTDPTVLGCYTDFSHPLSGCPRWQV